jgi:flavin-dependent dehydrogenase
MYDAIVVGARCGGAPVAMLLARKGYQTLLVDRSTFPSDIPHGHFMHQQGPVMLKRWGLLDKLAASNCPAIESMVLDLDDFPLQANDLSSDGVAFGYAPRRWVLDQILIGAATAAGVEFREAFNVVEFLSENHRITGIRGRDRHDREFIERATVTIGADGRNSRLAKVVKAATYDVYPTLTFWCFSYWSGVPSRSVEMYLRGSRALFAFPTNDGLLAVFVAAPISHLPGTGAALEQYFAATVDLVPEFAARMHAGRREERFYGAADLPNFFRKPYGPGWALVGDAGHHKDPYLALGIDDAFRDAQLLADALDEGFCGRQRFEVALEEYERRRNAAAVTQYHDNLGAAQFTPPSADLLRLRAALRSNPTATTQFFMARAGRVPREAFFNPENIQRVLRGGR